MENTNWLRQTPDKPLFPDILWSRPENKRHAGKLLIVGGHQQSFNAVSEAYAAALKAGIGTARVILPDKLQKMLAKLFPEAEYAPSTPIGSFSRQALDTLLEAAEWADGVLLGGDFGKNSETAILLESFTGKYNGQLAVTGDTLEYFMQKPTELLGRENTLVVAGVPKLQKLAQSIVPIKQRDDLVQMINKLSNLTDGVKANITTNHSSQVIVASQGEVSSTPAKKAIEDVELAACASVWWLQQPEKAFEAISTAAYEISSV